MAISHIATTTATNANGTSVTANKPASTATDDLLLAFFTSNNQNATAPAGWTELVDETVETFRGQVFYKVATGSEPTTYAFSVGSATILVLTITCIRGINTSSPIDIAAVADSTTGATEPYTTPTVAGGSNGRMFYFRAARRTTSTALTYTASGTELSGDPVVSAVTASGENPPNETAAKLNDGSAATKWLTFATTGWVRYQLTEAATVTNYELTSANDASDRDPKDWQLQGSNDGSSWTTLDTRTGETFATRGLKKSYSATSSVTYLYYRLNITANNGNGTSTQLADWTLIGNTPVSVTELSDVGTGSGSVAYSHALYMAATNYNGAGSKPGLGITASNTESHNIGISIGIKSDIGVTGTASVTLPTIPSVDMSGSWSHVAALGADMPLPTMDANIFVGDYLAALAATVPVTVAIAGNTPPLAQLTALILPVVDIEGETRFFGSNSVTPEREERWFVITQDGYYLGIRRGVGLPMRIEMPLVQVLFNLRTSTFAEVVNAEVASHNPTPAIVFSAGVASTASTTVYNATILTGRLAAPEETGEISAVAEDATVSIELGAGSANAAWLATDVIGASILAPSPSATVTAYNPSTGQLKTASAGHASVSVVANSIISNANSVIISAAVPVTASAFAPQIRTQANSGHVSVSCHN